MSTATATAAAAANLAFERISAVHSKPEQRKQRQQDVDEFVDGTQPTLVAGFTAAWQGGTGSKLASLVHDFDVPASRRDADRRKRREQRHDHSVAAVNSGLESTATFVVSASDEPDPSRRIRLHMEFSVTGLGEPEPMLRRAELQRVSEPVYQRRLLSNPDLAYASQPPGELSSSTVSPQHDVNVLDVALDQPPFEPDQ